MQILVSLFSLKGVDSCFFIEYLNGFFAQWPAINNGYCYQVLHPENSTVFTIYSVTLSF